MTRIISISNHKGGVAKTTSAVNIGAGIANLGKNVLMIDMDPQANLTVSFGISNPETTIYDALRGVSELKPIKIYKNLDVIPSTLDLSGAEMELSSEAGREFILKELLDPIKEKYDYIIIDCPPSLGLLTINAFTASEEVFIPIQPHYLAIKGLTKILEVVNKIKKRINRKIEITGVFVTLFDKRKVLHKDVYETIESYFGDRVFRARIRENIALAEAPSNGLDIFRYAPDCNGAFDYGRLAKEVIEMEKTILKNRETKE